MTTTRAVCAAAVTLSAALLVGVTGGRAATRAGTRARSRISRSRSRSVRPVAEAVMSQLDGADSAAALQPADLRGLGHERRLGSPNRLLYSLFGGTPPPVDTTPPTTSITSPTAEPPSADGHVTATAADDVGVTRVELSVDDSLPAPIRPRPTSSAGTRPRSPTATTRSRRAPTTRRATSAPASWWTSP